MSSVTQPVKSHPNAAVAVGTSPVTVLLVYVLTDVVHISPPAAILAALGNVTASLFLWAGKRNLMTPFRFVVDNGGVTGCCRMIWKGKHVGPTE